MGPTGKEKLSAPSWTRLSGRVVETFTFPRDRDHNGTMASVHRVLGRPAPPPQGQLGRASEKRTSGMQMTTFTYFFVLFFKIIFQLLGVRVGSGGHEAGVEAQARPAAVSGVGGVALAQPGRPVSRCAGQDAERGGARGSQRPGRQAGQPEAHRPVQSKPQHSTMKTLK